MGPHPDPILTRAVVTTTTLSRRIVTHVTRARHGIGHDPVGDLQLAQQLCRELATQLNLAELEVGLAIARRTREPKAAAEP